MRNTVIMWLAVMITALAGQVSAQSCSEAVAPKLPSALTAVTAELLVAQQAVHEYLQEQREFLRCVRSPRRHNKAVEAMHALADRYNQLVKAYRARRSNEAFDSYLTQLQPIEPRQLQG